MNDLHLDNQLCFKLYAASRAVTRGYKPMLDALGLTYPQYLVMLVLWEWHAEPPEWPTVKALGQRLRLDSGTLTPLLKRLQQLQLVARTRGAADEREVHLSLTAAGHALRNEVPALRERLICDSGVDLDRAQALAGALDELLRQFSSRQG
jgi:DNA-binding MarR family transcriptional regulator